MSAVVDFVKDVVGGVVEAVGDVVDTVVDVVKDVGRAVDKYVIQPILDDPLTAIATVAGATFLGPVVGAKLGSSLGAAAGYVGTGIGAAAGNTAAGLAQGESFDEAIKGGLMAGVTAGATSAGFDYLTGGGAFAPDAGTPSVSTPSLDTSLDYMPSEVGVNIDAFGNPIDTLAGTNPYAPSTAVATPSAVASPSLTGVELPPLEATAAPGAPGLQAPTAPAAPAAPSATGPVTAPEISPLASLDVATPGIDYSLAGAPRPSPFGIKAPTFAPDSSAFGLEGAADFSLVPPNISGPGLQPPSSANLASMRGGQGVTVEVPGMPEFRYADGTADTWMGDSGRMYGQGTESGTLGARGFTPTPEPIMYEPGPVRGLGDKLSSFDFQDITMKDVGAAGKSLADSAWNFAKENPLTTLGGISLLAGGFGGPPQMPQGGPPQRGATRDPNFNRPMDIYNYLRDRREMEDDIMRYGTTGGEHRFFENTRFVPVPIAAKTGGLMQLKQKYQDGGLAQPLPGQADPLQNMPMPGVDPMMSAMMAGPAMTAPQGQPAGMPARPPMQGGLSQMAGQPGPQGQPPQQSLTPSQMPRLNQDPQTAYYQYGQPPMDGVPPGIDPQQLMMMLQAAQGQQGMPQGRQPVMMNQGGPLNMVRSMNIGGGADGRSDDVDALLSDGEYVFDAETVALLGNGSSEAGADRLEQMRAEIRKHKGQNLARGKISPDAKSPLQYLKG